MMHDSPLLLGCDFSSSPSRQKTIVIALGYCTDGVVQLTELRHYRNLTAWQADLAAWPAWVGGFDLPFGLPRALVQVWGWPADWQQVIRHFSAQTRPELRVKLQAFCDARPPGHKFAHRATDGPAGSSPSMKWVNPPVAWMLHAGMPLLLDLNAHFPAHQAAVLTTPDIQNASCQRVALEAYPSLLARTLLGLPPQSRSLGYKQDDPKRQTPAQRDTRQRLLHTLLTGAYPWGLRLSATPAQQALCCDDGKGDVLDAVLCLMQAAWSWQQHHQGHPRWGLPLDIDPLEGWIVGA
jgi:hypothetical protein